MSESQKEQPKCPHCGNQQVAEIVALKAACKKQKTEHDYAMQSLHDIHDALGLSGHDILNPLAMSELTYAQRIRDLRSKCERLEKDFEEAVNEGARYHARCVKLEKELKVHDTLSSDAINEAIDLCAQVARLEKRTVQQDKIISQQSMICLDAGLVRESRDSLRQQNAELSAALEKKDEALKEGIGALEMLATFHRHSPAWESCGVNESIKEIKQALTIKPNPTALNALVNPLLDALKWISNWPSHESQDDRCIIARAAIRNWEARK